jgi:hypothetical protein
VIEKTQQRECKKERHNTKMAVIFVWRNRRVSQMVVDKGGTVKVAGPRRVLWLKCGYRGCCGGVVGKVEVEVLVWGLGLVEEGGTCFWVEPVYAARRGACAARRITMVEELLQATKHPPKQQSIQAAHEGASTARLAETFSPPMQSPTYRLNNGSGALSSTVANPTFHRLNCNPFLCFFPFFFFFFYFCFCFVRLGFLLTSGASSPEWVKPAAEGGGFL